MAHLSAVQPQTAGNTNELLDRISPKKYHTVLVIYLELSSAAVMMCKGRN
jgi:hypothetical protein